MLASEGFVAVTGYSRSQIIGRNCRFLQGPGTAPESVQRIRDGLNSGDGCTELLLNYRTFPFSSRYIRQVEMLIVSSQLIYLQGGTARRSFA